MRPYVLEETNWKTVKDTHFEMAILPWGAMEAHNYHLPYGTDNLQAEYVAIECARQAAEQSAKVIVLPTIPVGVNTQHEQIKLTLNLNPSTQAAILEDIIQCLEDAGIQKLVLLNGHGGNDFKPMIRELSPQTDIFIASIDWWKVVNPADYFDEVGDHAGEMETSILQVISPNLILPLEQAGVGAEKRARIKGLREKWAWSPREWHKISEDTGVGNPALATPEKGQAFLNAACTEIAQFLVELSQASLDDLYE